MKCLKQQLDLTNLKLLTLLLILTLIPLSFYALTPVNYKIAFIDDSGTDSNTDAANNISEESVPIETEILAEEEEEEEEDDDDDDDDDDRISLHPNLATDIITITFDTKKLSVYHNISFIISDNSGRELKLEQFETKNKSINISALPSNLYFIKIMSKQKLVLARKKFIKR